jgi:hypothetical protein
MEKATELYNLYGWGIDHNEFIKDITAALKGAREEGRKAGLEEGAKIMEQYGCSACDHFDHDASPTIIQAVKERDIK